MLRHLTVLVTIPQIRNIKRNTHHKKLTKVRLALPPHRELVCLPPTNRLLLVTFRLPRLRYLVLLLVLILTPTAAQGTGMAEKSPGTKKGTKKPGLTKVSTGKQKPRRMAGVGGGLVGVSRVCQSHRPSVRTHPSGCVCTR